MANIFSFAKVSNQHRIIYDSNEGDVFNIYHDGKTIKFPKTDEGLYCYRISEDTKTKMKKGKMEKKIMLVEMIKENMEGFSSEEITRAKRARKLYHSLGAPSTTNFKYLIKSNQIKNCPVTVKDIDNAEKYLERTLRTSKARRHEANQEWYRTTKSKYQRN